MALFLTVRMDQSVFVEVPSDCVPAGPNTPGRLIQMILREKRGRTARIEIVAPKDVYVDVRPRNGVKGASNKT
jgi:hypothetical protein